MTGAVIYKKATADLDLDLTILVFNEVIILFAPDEEHLENSHYPSSWSRLFSVFNMMFIELNFISQLNSMGG